LVYSLGRVSRLCMQSGRFLVWSGRHIVEERETMNRHPSLPAQPLARRVADQAFNALERFLHIEAVSGTVLLAAATIALIWANSPAASSYTHLWHMPLTFSLGEHVISRSLHFWINDALM